MTTNLSLGTADIVVLCVLAVLILLALKDHHRLFSKVVKSNAHLDLPAKT